MHYVPIREGNPWKVGPNNKNARSDVVNLCYKRNRCVRICSNLGNISDMQITTLFDLIKAKRNENSNQRERKNNKVQAYLWSATVHVL